MVTLTFLFVSLLTTSLFLIIEYSRKLYGNLEVAPYLPLCIPTLILEYTIGLTFFYTLIEAIVDIMQEVRYFCTISVYLLVINLKDIVNELGIQREEV